MWLARPARSSIPSASGSTPKPPSPVQSRRGAIASCASTDPRQLAVLFLVVRLQLSHDTGIRERGCVAKRFTFGDVPQQAAHNLAGPRLGQIRGEEDVVGPRDRADLLHHVLLEIPGERLG